MLNAASVQKTAIFIVISPVFGFVAAFVLMLTLLWMFRRTTPGRVDSWFRRLQLASAAAWSPNPKNPPLYLDLPSKDGVVSQDVLARWAANAPLAFVDQYIGNLRQYRGIAIDVGDQDGLKAGAAKLHEILAAYGVANAFEIYSGTHTSAVAAWATATAALAGEMPAVGGCSPIWSG